MNPRTFDMGDPEPEGVQRVADFREEWYDTRYDFCWSPYWNRTASRGWKGYDNGERAYLTWDELTRRFGPLLEQEEA